MCTSGKIMYSKKEAGTIVNLCTRGHQHSKAKTVPCRFYSCPICGTYHTTHLPIWKYKKEQYKNNIDNLWR